jgi:two-component system sensor histidine kinase/response regulator
MDHQSDHQSSVIQDLKCHIERLESELKTLRLASEAKSDFIAHISHEFRTPMNSIIGMSRILGESKLDRDQQECLYAILWASETLLTLLNDILDLEKIESGNLTLESIPFDLRVCLEEIVEFLAVKAHEKNLELIVQYEANCPRWVMGDPTRLRQIITNLTGNAIKYTQMGHIVIKVRCVELRSNDALMEISVIDTGVGIPENRLRAIFQKYVQANISDTRHYGGTGLGLAISERLVELMKGDISVSSKVGEGSNFSLRIPMNLDQTAHIPLCLNTDLRQVKILVIDSHAVRQEVMVSELERVGMKVEITPTADRGLEMLLEASAKGDPYEIAIIDNHIPPRGGEHLGRQIKSIQSISNTALVYISAFGHRGDASFVKKAGFAAYLVKPIREAQLIEVLSAVLHAKHHGQASDQLITHHRITETKKALGEQQVQQEKFPNVRILLTEDNEVNQMLAKRIFGKLECDLDIAPDGQVALDRLSQQSYDMIFMDCMMPIMDGYEATKQIRLLEKETGKHIAIVAMTANVMKGDNEECLAAGMDDYISKPVRPEKIIDMIRKWAVKKD